MQYGKKLFCKLFRADILQVLRLLQYNMGFIRIGVKVITSFCKCPNIRTTLHNTMQCTGLGLYSCWQIYLLLHRKCCLNTLPHSRSRNNFMFQARVETSRKDVFFILLYLILWGNVENKKVKKKNYAIYFMFSFELELYAIQSIFDMLVLIQTIHHLNIQFANLHIL